MIVHLAPKLQKNSSRNYRPPKASSFLEKFVFKRGQISDEIIATNLLPKLQMSLRKYETTFKSKVSPRKRTIFRESITKLRPRRKTKSEFFEDFSKVSSCFLNFSKSECHIFLILMIWIQLFWKELSFAVYFIQFRCRLRKIWQKRSFEVIIHFSSYSKFRYATDR